MSKKKQDYAAYHREWRRNLKESNPEKYSERLRKARIRNAAKRAAETPEEHSERLRKLRERYKERLSNPKEREKIRQMKRRNSFRTYMKLKSDPVRYAEHLEKDAAAYRARRAANLEKYRAIDRKNYHKHKEERSARHREYHKRTRDLRNAMSSAYYYENRERLLSANRSYLKIPANRERSKLRARMNYAKRKTMRLCDLDLDALLAYLKHGTPPPWKQRVDYASQYSPDALIGKCFSMESDDIRAAELRGYGLERAIEAKGDR